jgi:hypothetical protein
VIGAIRERSMIVLRRSTRRRRLLAFDAELARKVGEHFGRTGRAHAEGFAQLVIPTFLHIPKIMWKHMSGSSTVLSCGRRLAVRSPQSGACAWTSWAHGSAALSRFSTELFER